MTSPSPRGCRPGRRHTHLIDLLAALKDRSRLSYAQLAARTAGLKGADGVSASTLKRAVDPRAMPQEHVVTAFVRACGAAVEVERDVLKVWRAARAENRGIPGELRAPSVSSVRTAPTSERPLSPPTNAPAPRPCSGSTTAHNSSSTSHGLGRATPHPRINVPRVIQPPRRSFR
ncbi:helix-turn-helix domain-containing protein [Streptomyces sp. JNUCC 64]